MGKRKDLTGQIFGKLTILERSNRQPGIRGIYWLCQCDCINKTKVEICTQQLKSRSHTGCGCGRRKQFSYTREILTKEYLIENYIKQKKTVTQIRKECGFSQTTPIYRALNYYGISERNGQPSGFVGELRLIAFKRIEDGALKRNLEFDITPNQIWDLFLKQDRKCALTGLELVINTDKWYDRSNITASLDRINSKRGYTIDNVQWVHKRINMMKQNIEEKEFYEFCKNVFIYNKDKYE